MWPLHVGTPETHSPILRAHFRRCRTCPTDEWKNGGVRLGIAHHYGWAVAVTASDEHKVVDRRRIELIEDGLPEAPVHHLGGTHDMHSVGDPLDDDALALIVARVRASVVRTALVALDELPASIVS